MSDNAYDRLRTTETSANERSAARCPYSPVEPCERQETQSEGESEFWLEIYDDVCLPENTELVVEGTGSPVVLLVSNFYDQNKGIYRFPIEVPPSGSSCRIFFRMGETSITIMEGVDLHAFLQQAEADESTPPLPIHLSDELFDHVLTYDGMEIYEPVPEEDDDWDIPGEFDEDEIQETETVEDIFDEPEYEIDPYEEN